MPARCIDCAIEIEEGPLCIDCAPLVLARIEKLKKGRARERRKPSYNEYARETPLRPITLPPVRFGKRSDEP